MWQRTKRLVNSYLDNLISKSERPDSEVRELGREEISRLNDLEVRSRANSKMLQKELAETDLKLTGALERARIAQQTGNAEAASSAAADVEAFSQHREFLKNKIAEAESSATRAAALREERRQQVGDLANQTHLATMNENLAGIHSGMSATDPGSTIDEMRARIGRASDSTDFRVAQADREIEAADRKSRVDDLLAQYKHSIKGEVTPAVSEDSVIEGASGDEPKIGEKAEKTLGKAEDTLRPID